MRITTFKWVPPANQGHVKDHRVRWACEEAGLTYEIRLIDGAYRDTPAYRKEQPFGQVPVLEDKNLTLFESGSILLYLGEKSEILLPRDHQARARVTSWVFAALNSIEPAVQSFNDIADQNPKEGELKTLYATSRTFLKKRLDALGSWLKDKEFLEDRFSIGDIAMSTVLRDLNNMGVLEEHPVLFSYRQRCEARPAFQKALADQLKSFADHAPKT